MQKSFLKGFVEKVSSDDLANMLEVLLGDMKDARYLQCNDSYTIVFARNDGGLYKIQVSDNNRMVLSIGGIEPPMSLKKTREMVTHLLTL